LKLHALNNKIANEFGLQPVSDEDYELVTKNVEEQKPNVVENTLKATSSNAAPSLNASQTLSPVDSKTIE
jgi:prophage tail gpP-like protein